MFGVHVLSYHTLSKRIGIDLATALGALRHVNSENHLIHLSQLIFSLSPGVAEVVVASREYILRSHVCTTNCSVTRYKASSAGSLGAHETSY